ncbi:MAG: hypothetical protein M3N16_02155 [Actinomycetota bacterium]|nr:hypothetical protein [Actinomycetota bacterium]
MIDRHIERPWPEDVLQALERFKQGDLIERPPFFYGVRPGTRVWSMEDEAHDPADGGSQVEELHPDDGPSFGIITSQTCDLNEQGPPTQPWLQVSPVYLLEGTEADQEKLLQKAYIVELTGTDLPLGRWVADLRIELPLEKTALVGREPIPGFASETEADSFARRLGVRRARAALANELVETVVRLIRKRKANNKRRSEEVWTELYKLGLQIEEGTRLKPVAVRLHVISSDEPSDRVTNWFEQWEDKARLDAAEVGITLHTTRHHNARNMDVRLADRLIDLDM